MENNINLPDMPDENDARKLGWLIVTDYVNIRSNKSAAAAINKLITDNPNRTFYFPDGVYYLESPVLTPADPKKSVDLRLSNYAVLTARSDVWNNQGAVVKLGGIYPFNDTGTPGSNYSMTGGVVNGNGVADGVEILSGRETRVSGVSMKNVHTGLHIAYGANSGSSDADISDLSIICCGKKEDTGIFIEGFDNTLTNIRIGKANIGVRIKSQANSMRNIHPLYNSDFADFEGSVGFLDESGANFYSFCYSDQFRYGFVTNSDTMSKYTDCFCFWWSSRGSAQTAFKANGKFNSCVNGLTVGFRPDTDNRILEVAKDGGNGVLRDLAFNTGKVTDKSYEKYAEGPIFSYG